MRWAVGVVLCVIALGCDGRRDAVEAVWGEGGGGPGQFNYPRAMAYAPASGHFYVVDRNARIQELDGAGRYVRGWRMPEWSQGKPVGLTVGPDGNLYVADTHYHRVIVFRPDGTELRRFGRRGPRPGEFVYPTDIAFDEAGRMYVSEYGDNDRIQVWDERGEWLRSFGTFGSGPGEMSRPQSMVVMGGRVYVTDACNHRVCVFTLEGTFERAIGGPGGGVGEFRFPYGLEKAGEGRLLVTEFGNSRVQLIDVASGRGVRVWGSAGRAKGELAYPWASVVDGAGRLVTIDSGNNRLVVWGVMQ